jgi:hypothetical protein
VARDHADRPARIGDIRSLSVSSADWYDPQTGRFLSQDPIGLAGGVNLYAYAGNNPASYSDPFGLDTVQTDPQTQAKLNAECARSSDFCASYKRLEADPTIWTLQVVGSGTPLPGNSLSGNTTVNRLTVDLSAFGGVGQLQVVTGGTIQIKPSDFAQNSRQEGGLKFTFGTVVAHEFGHALGNIAAAKARPTSATGKFLVCLEPCAKVYENRYRAQTNLGYRP